MPNKIKPQEIPQEHKPTYVASHADILLARHAIFPPQRTSAETSGAFFSDCLKSISYPESSGSLVSGLVARRDSGEMEFFPQKSGVPVVVRMLIKTEVDVNREVGMLDESLGYPKSLFVCPTIESL